MTDLNYIEYFSDVEDLFIRLRGKSLLLSPLDWTLIESWKRGIPLRVVLRSIEEVFESHKSKARRRGINSLRYCQDEVDSQYSEWLQSQVGKNNTDPGAVATGSDRNPFAKENVLSYLDAARTTLLTVHPTAPECLRLVVWHVVEKLDALVLGIARRRTR
jgi:hypothetical protein